MADPFPGVECMHGRPLDGRCPECKAMVAGGIPDGVPIIQSTAATPGRCEMCGDVKETRPYGPNGEEVCFSCGMKDEAAMKRAFHRRVA